MPGRVHVVGNLLLPVRAENPVYDFLGTPALVTIGYLLPSGATREVMMCRWCVVGVMVGVDEPRLSGFGISHFLEVSVREIQQFGFRHLSRPLQLTATWNCGFRMRQLVELYFLR